MSGIVGVHWNKITEKWISRISINGKNVILGSFDNFKDAKLARKEAERKYFAPVKLKEVVCGK